MGHSATMEGRINGDEVEVTERLMQGFHTGPHFQITRVWAKNFRSIADVSFELDPLTILVGPNASGKSNLLDILRFIKDALRNLEMAVSRRNGMEGVARHVTWDGDSNLLDIEMGVSSHSARPPCRAWLLFDRIRIYPCVHGQWGVLG